MQDIVGWVFARCACLHVNRCCMCWQYLHVPLIGEKVGGTGSYTSSNIISCLMALYTRLALLTRRLAQIAEIGWFSGLHVHVCPSCVMSWVISNNVHTLVVVIVEYTHSTCNIEAVSSIWTSWHLQNWWCIAKSKMFNELERGGIYLWNHVRHIHRYIHTYIHT